MKSFHQFFQLGMKRTIADLVMPINTGIRLNLGGGFSRIPDSISLDLPEWDADVDAIPYRDGTVNCIHAYHFFEHLVDPVAMLKEYERVLIPGGVLNICVPYYTSQMMAHDLDHKHAFCEETWRVLMRADQPHEASKGKAHLWKFRIGFNVICGVVERNLCLLTQLVRIS